MRQHRTSRDPCERVWPKDKTKIPLIVLDNTMDLLERRKSAKYGGPIFAERGNYLICLYLEHLLNINVQILCNMEINISS